MGCRGFRSKRRLTEVLIQVGLASGNQAADGWIGALIERFCVPEHTAEGRPDKPIVTSAGPRNATVFTWRDKPAAGADRR